VFVVFGLYKMMLMPYFEVMEVEALVVLMGWLSGGLSVHLPLLYFPAP